MSATKTTFPAVPQDLLLALEKQFPNVCPPASVGLEGLRYLQGEQAVVQLLRRHFDRQNQTVLKGN